MYKDILLFTNMTKICCVFWGSQMNNGCSIHLNGEMDLKYDLSYELFNKIKLTSHGTTVQYSI